MSLNTDDAAPGRSRGIQSLETGLGVLAALAACGGPAALSTVAQAAGLSASQTHRYLASLVAAGMAKQDPRGHYDLDSGAIRIGLAALARLDVFASVDDFIGAYARESGRTCLVAVWGDAGATVVRWYAGNPPVITTLAVGSVLPLLQSATGRVFFAFGAPDYFNARAQAEKRAGRAPAQIDLAALRAQARAELCARVDGDFIPGLRVVSVPVFDLQGNLCVVVTSVATSAFDRAADEKAERELRSACRRLTEALGGRWPAG